MNAGAAEQEPAAAQRHALRVVIDHSKPRQSGFEIKPNSRGHGLLVAPLIDEVEVVGN